jgi:membrane-associated phospholipid phosphatase
MGPIPWSYYATPLELGFKPWALDFAPDNYGGRAFPSEDVFVADPTPTGLDLQWQTDDWDPALRFWTLDFDPRLGVWLRGQDTSLPSILAACEFAREHDKWRFDTNALIAKGWLTEPDHLRWQREFDPFILNEIHAMFDMMEDDRDRYMGEINVQADGLPAYFMSFLNLDGERRPWTIELIRCGLAIGNVVYMNYKAMFRRVRPSTIAPGLVPPFGPPHHPSFPSGHSFLGHFIALLLLEIEPIMDRFGEPTVGPQGLERPLRKPLLSEVMSTNYTFTGPLLWLGARLAKNRERAGVHYPSDSLASRWLAGAIWALLTMPRVAGNDTTPVPDAKPPNAPANSVQNQHLIVCPTFRRVLSLAKSEWV